MEDRKARLAALAAKAGRRNQNDSHNADDTVTDEHDTATTTLAADDIRHHPDSHTARKKRKINFRNYIPSDPTLIQSNNNGDNNDVTVTTANPTSHVIPQHPSVPTNPLNTTTTALQQQNTATQVVATQTKTTKSVLQLALEQARLEIHAAGSHTSPLGNHPPATTSAANNIVSPPPHHHHNNNNNNNKINADLKRNCQSKLRLLEKRTQTALVSILRERLEQEATTATAK